MIWKILTVILAVSVAVLIAVLVKIRAQLRDINEQPAPESGLSSLRRGCLLFSNT